MTARLLRLAEIKVGVEEGRIKDDLEDQRYDREELEALQRLYREAQDCGIGDWNYGTTLISDDYFPTYAEELAEEVGAIDKEQSWPSRHIDWDEASKDLQQGYYMVSFDGKTYWAP